jgi:DNA polymerase/3'-5' exonuclease PolX
LKTGKKIAGKTETEIYHALGKKYKKPENRK